MEIIRGDNKTCKFQRKDNNGAVIQYPASEVYFTVKESNLRDEFLFQKKLSDGTMSFDTEDFYYRFEILPADTNDLSYGTYEYDIERIYLGKVKTISIGTLKVNKEITFASNESGA